MKKPDHYELLLDGQPAEGSLYELMTSIEVEENADLPGAVELTIPITTRGKGCEEDLAVIGEDRFKPYGSIAVVATPGNTRACLFDGYLLSQKIHLDAGTTASEVRLWGQDATCLMNLEERVKEHTASDGNVANEIFNAYGFQPAPDNTNDDSPDHTEPRRTLMQRSTDAQFLRDRARRSGKLFRVACEEQPGRNIGYFVRPKLEADPAVTLVLNPPEAANLDALDISWDVARPTEVCASILLSTKDAVDGGTTSSGLATMDARSLAKFIGSDFAMKARLTTVADSVDELRQRSASLLTEAGWFVRCEGEVDLSQVSTVMRAGQIARVDGAGYLHSGNYLVWSVRHTITPEAHRMTFVLVRNAIGNVARSTP